MNESETPAFRGGRNVAIKVPEHAFEATVAFYRDTLRLTLVYDAAGTKAFDFGPIRLWIDRMAHLAQAEMWLELIAPDTADNPQKQIELIVERGYQEYLKSNFENAESREEDLRQLSSLAAGFRSTSEFLSELALVNTERFAPPGGTAG